MNPLVTVHLEPGSMVITAADWRELVARRVGWDQVPRLAVQVANEPERARWAMAGTTTVSEPSCSRTPTGSSATSATNGCCQARTSTSTTPTTVAATEA